MHKLIKIQLTLFITASFALISSKAYTTEESSRILVEQSLNSIWLLMSILEPVAKGYNKLPSAVRTGTSNFTSNIGTLLSIPNNFYKEM